MRIKIADRYVGEDEPCFIVLEAGMNYQNIEEARRLIDKGIEIGADAIKFQTFHADTLSIKKAFLVDGRGELNQYEEAKESEEKNTKEFQMQLFDYCRKREMIAFSTPSHQTDVDLLEEIGIPAYKLGSDDLTNLRLLKYIAELGKPMIISSGVSTIAEVDEAIRTIRGTGNDQIILMHCISNYPADPKDVNLRVLKTLSTTFQIPVGFSDHTETIAVPIAAVALGAKVIEKHFTLDRTQPGPDNFFSTEPREMKMIIRGIREIEKAMGSPIKKPTPSESRMRFDFRKSIFAVKKISKGTTITEDMVDIKRPDMGISPKFFDIVVGRTAKVDINIDDPITWDKI